MKLVFLFAFIFSSCATVVTNPSPQPGIIPPAAKYMLYSQEEMARLEKLKSDVLGDYKTTCPREINSFSYMSCYYKNAVPGHPQTQPSIIANIQNLKDMRLEEENLSPSTLPALFRHMGFLILLVKDSAEANRYLYSPALENYPKSELKAIREIEDKNITELTKKICAENIITLNDFAKALTDGKHPRLKRSLRQRDIDFLRRENSIAASGIDSKK